MTLTIAFFSSFPRENDGSVASLKHRERSLLGAAIASYAATARALGLRAWLAFMPCKRRVLAGALVWTGPEKPRPIPLAIPELVEDLARANGIRFVDLTPALRRETTAGRATYNAVWDTHLNRLGSLKVAETPSAALAQGAE